MCIIFKNRLNTWFWKFTFNDQMCSTSKLNIKCFCSTIVHCFIWLNDAWNCQIGGSAQSLATESIIFEFIEKYGFWHFLQCRYDSRFLSSNLLIPKYVVFIWTTLQSHSVAKCHSYDFIWLMNTKMCSSWKNWSCSHVKTWTGYSVKMNN